MQNKSEEIELLNQKNIQITAMRTLVLQFFFNQRKAISLHDLEENFHFSERTTLYRTLKKFEEKGLVHQINDGTQSSKYALCSKMCSSKKHTDFHPHFYCEKCESTTCLNLVKIPKIKLNKDLKVNSTELIFKGICDVCNRVA